MPADENGKRYLAMRVDAELLDAVDAIVPKGGRTTWVEDAMRAKLAGSPVVVTGSLTTPAEAMERAKEIVGAGPLDDPPVTTLAAHTRAKHAEQRTPEAPPTPPLPAPKLDVAKAVRCLHPEASLGKKERSSSGLMMQLCGECGGKVLAQ